MPIAPVLCSFRRPEKELEYASHYLNISKGDQFDLEYLKINLKADKPTTRIQAFADLEEGADYLKWKRSR